MIKKDSFQPDLDKDLQKKLVSTFLLNKEMPIIYMDLHQEKDVEYEVHAKVTFKFYIQEKKNKVFYDRVFEGTQVEVYKDAARLSSRISLNCERLFNKEWNKTLMHLMNKPSKDKSILNLGIYQNKRESFGQYTIKTPGELLQEKIISSGFKGKDIANMTGINEATLYKYLKNDIEISRDTAVKLGKILGCDPADLIFNSLYTPIWGMVDTTFDGYENGYSIYPGEITELPMEQFVKCPRETYRPDVKAIKISGESMMDNYTAFYYDNPSDTVNGKICVVGVMLKNFKDDQVRLRYFIGIVEPIKGKKNINIINMDPYNHDVTEVEADEDIHTFDSLQQLAKDQKYLIENVDPEFISPIVSFVDNTTDQKTRSEIIKAYDTYYTASRKDEIKKVEEFRKAKVRAAIKGKVMQSVAEFYADNKYYENDSALEAIAYKKLKLLMNNDNRFRNLLTKIGTGKYKTEKQTKSTTLVELEDLSKNLTAKENEIAEAAYLEFEEDRMHEEALNQEPMNMDK